MSIRVFISYRRRDCPEFVQTIRDQFVARYKRNNVFVDFDSIPPAAKWRECLERNIANCDVFVLIMGPQWLELMAERQRSGAMDYVIYEIEQALRYEKIIVPVCIEEAALPNATDLPESIHGLLDYLPVNLHSGADFSTQFAGMLADLEREVLAHPSNVNIIPSPSDAIIRVLVDIPPDEFNADAFVDLIRQLVSIVTRDNAVTIEDISIIQIHAGSLLVDVQLPPPAAAILVDLFETKAEKLLEYHILEILPIALVDFRYELRTKLGGGGMGTVYKAYDWVNQETVALKKVKAQVGESTRFNREVLLTLSHEFKILSRMRHPYIIGVLDYGFIAQDEPYFTMEYLDAAATILDYAQVSTHITKLKLLVQTLEALRYMHWQQFLHRDLKPPNILVTSGMVKVLDFGISMMKAYRANATTAGTIAYMSPEAFMEENAENLTDASDLWSIGVIAYEIFVGTHPFDAEETFQKLTRILTEEPPWDDLDVDENILPILQRLLMKERSDRFQDAETVIQHINQAALEPLQVGSQDESYLQTAPFTGRDAELATLRGDLEAARNQQGNLRFIVGEAGVGKSRLVDELRIEALVDGVMVLRGQATHEAASPYHLWQIIVRRLCLMVTLTDLQAGILKSIVPDIEELIGRYLPSVPDLPDATALQTRLFDTVDFVIRHCPRPLLILLEDLHWTDEDSLALLKHIQGGLSNHHVLIIGTFRTLQAHDLHEQFPDVPLLTLQPLQDNDVEDLVQKILVTNEMDTDVLSLLKQEAKGNAFSLVEIIRALAEHSEGISKIGKKPIPEAIFKQGMVTVIESRLNRLEPSDRMLLQLAAVAGQELDLTLLRQLQPQHLEQWLRICAVNNILEVDDGLWHFSHNRLREVLLGTLSTQEAQVLHGRIAEGKIQLYGTNPSNYAAIAMHWETAGLFDEAGEWYYKAAQVAQAAYSTAQAIEFYRKALIYLDFSDARRLAIGEILGKLLRLQAQFDDAWKILDTARRMAVTTGDTLALVRILIGMSDVRQDEGQLDEALTLTEEAEKTARASSLAGRELFLEALNNKTWIFILQEELDKAREVAQGGLAIAPQAQFPRQRANFLNRLGEISAYRGDFKTSKTRIKQAMAIGRRLRDERSVSVALNNLGEIYRMSGETDEAVKYFNQALTIHEKLGAYDGKLIALTNLGDCYNELNQFARAEEHTNRVFDILNGRDWWGLHQTYPSHITALHEQGKYGEALKFAKDWQERTNRRKDEQKREMVKAFAQKWQERAAERGNPQEIAIVKVWLASL